MPPRAQVKADAAKKQKQVEDKTFGLKNKSKSKAVQKYVQQLQSTVNAKDRRAEPDVKEVQKKKKEDAAARERELNELFKVAITQPKVPVGVDPKSVVCEFFRRGQCTKGFKCKYSHDMNVGRKGEKIDLFSDQRDGEEETMEDWDLDKLEKVVASKGTEYVNENKGTEIVCKHFLDAVEKKQYGWFWACPNGGKQCMYRHALPPGYVLKSQMKALLQEEAANKPSLEESIEEDRHKLHASTPLTTALFMEWKRKMQDKKNAEAAVREGNRLKLGRLSGRELFAQDASLFVDDDEAVMEYEREEPWAAETSTSQNTESAADTGKDEEPAQAENLEDDDDFDIGELEELEASLTNTTL
eukprot:TRINITY_DN6167_c0_g2_i1.p1 TRINITY_DN6167_c0_g2~~TRINITY_DN6167_c0_g2_i1.p1  ORF type:complete len:357 (-),score=102.97 TRINITY_DN6167_c0_g2_i1:49-1119(-)